MKGYTCTRVSTVLENEYNTKFLKKVAKNSSLFTRDISIVLYDENENSLSSNRRARAPYFSLLGPSPHFFEGTWKERCGHGTGKSIP
jgi:hypothetical protein